jgi:hypothetical protein
MCRAANAYVFFHGDIISKPGFFVGTVLSLGKLYGEIEIESLGKIHQAAQQLQQFLANFRNPHTDCGYLWMGRNPPVFQTLRWLPHPIFLRDSTSRLVQDFAGPA